LFYRLNVIRLTIPPLRDRRDEIAPLAHHFVGRAAKEFSKGRVRLAEDTLEHLLLYAWPGHIRQLQNELRRMVALADGDAPSTPPSPEPSRSSRSSRSIDEIRTRCVPSAVRTVRSRPSLIR